MINQKKRKRMVNDAVVVCLLTLYLSGCGLGPTGNETANTEGTSNVERVQETKRTTEDIKKEIIKKIQNTDFTIQNAPIDPERYDAKADQAYKTAFLKAVTNQIPILDQNKKVYYKDIVQSAEGLDEAGFLRLIKQSDYYYQDFDGDGLPELTVNTDGPCVLKYNPEKEAVELYYQKEIGWNLLGTGQMFYYWYGYVDDAPDGILSEYPENLSVIVEKHAYETLEFGEVKQKVMFHDIMTSEPGADWVKHYKVSADEYKEAEVNVEEWRELIDPYFTASVDAPYPMSFAVMFDVNEDGTFQIYDEPLRRYMPEDLDLLLMNEETGEEWELYQRMLKGDFSLVEEENWVSLQSRYEDSLKYGNGRCDWSYFLMDFNQDGWKELCIRYYKEGVNNTAFFRYEDGHVKMWGSYGSADSHGYQIPLANGKMISVSWYQDDETRWIKRLNSKCQSVKELSYSSGITGDEDSRTEADTITEDDYFYHFQDYYVDGQLCGASVDLTKEEMDQIEAALESLYIPESKWKTCSEFTPMTVRPEIPGV